MMNVVESVGDVVKFLSYRWCGISHRCCNLLFHGHSELTHIDIESVVEIFLETQGATICGNKMGQSFQI